MRRSPGLARTLRSVAVALPLILGACAVNPVTQERQLSFMSLEEEKEAGAEAYEVIEEQIGFVREEALTAYVRSIGTRLAAHSPRKDVEYTFYVLDSEEVNAFCTPGAYIYVSRGLLQLMNSEDELAGVLGHEIGHAAALHVSTADWRGAMTEVLTGVGALAGTLVGGPLGAIGLGTLVQNTGGKAVAAHQREKETQADEIGQELMLKAGWDPARLSDFFRAADRYDTQQQKAVRVASAFDSHPMDVERMSSAKSRAERLGKPAPGADPKLDRPAFLARMRGVVIGQDVRAGIFDKKEPTLFLQPDMGFRIRFPDGWVTANAPSFVAAGDGPVGVLLELDSEGDDVKAASSAYLKKVQAQEREEAKPKKKKKDDKSKEEDASQQTKDRPQLLLSYDRRKAGMRRIGKDRSGKERLAYVIEGTAVKGQITVLQHWVAVPPNVLRVTCVIFTGAMQAYLDDCRQTVGSLVAIRRKDRERAKQVTVDFAEAQAGEALEDFNERTQNVWSVETTAAANGLSLPYVLTEGQLVKYAHSQVYEPPARPQADAPDEEE
jgi:predicted Zn-dependent protease